MMNTWDEGYRGWINLEVELIICISWDGICEPSQNETKKRIPFLNFSSVINWYYFPPNRPVTVTEDQLDRLSTILPHENYHPFCRHLVDIDFNEADRILDTCNNDYKLASRKVMAKWVTKTGGNIVDMMACLKLADVSGLCDKVLEKPYWAFVASFCSNFEE